MTVPVPGSLTYSYDEDGSTTVFPYPVRFLEPQELTVIREVAGAQTVLAYNVDYTVSGAGNPSGGSITRTAVTDGGKIIIARSTAWKQIVDLEDKARNPAEAVELQMDRLTMAGQDVARRVDAVEVQAAQIDDAVRRSEEAAEAAESAEQAAEEAAEAAEQAAGSVQFPVSYGISQSLSTSQRLQAQANIGVADLDTVARFGDYEASADQNFIRTAGYSASGDGGGALYARVLAEPSHGLKRQTLDGAWWEYAEPEINLLAAGLKGDGSDDTAAFTVAATAANLLGRKLVCRDASKTFKLIRAPIEHDIEIDLGGASLLSDFKGPLQPNNCTNVLKALGGFATGSFTFSGAGANTNTFTVGSQVYTLVTSAVANANEFWRGENAEARADATAFALASVINKEFFTVISFVSETGAFTVGQTVTGGTSGRTAKIAKVFSDGTKGVMFVLGESGAFSATEVITDPLGGSATTHGPSRSLFTSSTPKNAVARATATGSVVTITALAEGVGGNAVALAETSASAVASGATLSGGKTPINITLRNAKINGQNDGTALSGTGEPLIHIVGGDTVKFDNVEVVNGGNRDASRHTTRLDYTNAEVLIHSPKLVQINNSKFWSCAGETLEIYSWTGDTVYQIVGTVFDKTRSYNPALNYSNSCFNALNCHRASYMEGCIARNCVKTALNIAHHGGSFRDILIDGVTDSAGIDFNEAGSFRFNGARMENIFGRNISGSVVRTSGSNVEIDGIETENCLNGVRYEGNLANVAHADAWLNTADEITHSIRINRFTSRGSNVANSIGIDARGVNAAQPLIMRVGGMRSDPAPGLADLTVGISATNVDLDVTDRLDVGSVALIRMNGVYADFCASSARFKPSATGDVLRMDGVSGLAIGNIVFEDSEREGALGGGAGDIAFTNAPTINGRVYLNRSSTVTTITGATVPVARGGGVMVGSAAYNPPPISAGGRTSTTVTVVGAKTTDFAFASFGGDLSGLIIEYAKVTAADTVTVGFMNPTASSIDATPATLTALVMGP